MNKGSDFAQFEMGLPFEEAIGIRLEMVDGLPVWETHPAIRHQSVVFRIQSSIQRTAQGANGNECGCWHYGDIYVRFPEGSLKRPDIAIFCREPEEQETAVTSLPEAVIEVLSPGYEKKDTEVGVPFYLVQGIRDVITFDPRSGQVIHFHPDGQTEYTSPVTLTFACGCVCTV